MLELLGVSKGQDDQASAALRAPQTHAASAPVQSADLLPDLLDSSEPPGSLGHASGAGGEAGLGGGLVDLLDGGGGGGGDSIAADGAPKETAASLFQGLAVSDAGPQAAASQSQDPFSGLEAVASPTVDAQAVAGLGVEVPTSVAAPPPQQPLGDLLGEDVDALFDGLSVSANDSQAAAARPTRAPSHLDKSAILNAYAVPTPLTTPPPGLPGAGPQPPQGMAFAGMPVAPGMLPVPQGPAAAALWHQQQLQLQQQQMALARAMQMGGVPVPGAGGHMMGHMGGMAPGLGMPFSSAPGGSAGGGMGMGVGALDPLDFTAGANQQAKAAASAPSSAGAARKDDTHAFDFVSVSAPCLFPLSWHAALGPCYLGGGLLP